MCRAVCGTRTRNATLEAWHEDPFTKTTFVRRPQGLEPRSWYSRVMGFPVPVHQPAKAGSLPASINRHVVACGSRESNPVLWHGKPAHHHLCVYHGGNRHGLEPQHLHAGCLSQLSYCSHDVTAGLRAARGIEPSHTDGMDPYSMPPCLPPRRAVTCGALETPPQAVGDSNPRSSR